jgi:hypothetical protein
MLLCVHGRILGEETAPPTRRAVGSDTSALMLQRLKLLYITLKTTFAIEKLRAWQNRIAQTVGA